MRVINAFTLFLLLSFGCYSFYYQRESKSTPGEEQVRLLLEKNLNRFFTEISEK